MKKVLADPTPSLRPFWRHLVYCHGQVVVDQRWEFEAPPPSWSGTPSPRGDEPNFGFFSGLLAPFSAEVPTMSSTAVPVKVVCPVQSGDANPVRQGTMRRFNQIAVSVSVCPRDFDTHTHK